MKITEFNECLLDSYVELSSYGTFDNIEKISKIVDVSFAMMSLDLNIAILEHGEISVDSKFEKELGSKYKTTQITNRKLFYNGLPLMESLTIHCKEAIATKIWKYAVCSGLLDSDKIEGFKKISVSLKSINFDEFKHDVNKDMLCGLFLDYMKNKAYQKVLNYYKPKDKKDNYAIMSTKYTPETVEYLKSIGVSDSGYKSSYESSNVYNKPIDLSVSGFSNLPKIEDVLKRLGENKPQTTVGKIMADFINQYNVMPNKELFINAFDKRNEHIINTLRQAVYGYILSNNININSLESDTYTVNMDGFAVTLETKH